MNDDERPNPSQDEAAVQQKTADNAEESSDPAQAFEALRNAVEAYGEQHSSELDGLRKDLVLAFEQFQEFALSVDPAQEVGKIVQAVSMVSKRLEDIERSPLLKHGPDHYANMIDRAGQSLVRNAVDKLDRQSGDLERISRQLAGHVEGARQRRQQDRHLLTAGVTGIVFGIVATLILPWVLPSSAGMSVAATVMNADRWNAGMALMKSADGDTWNQMVGGYNLARGNMPMLAECQDAAIKTGKEQKCTVIVAAPEKGTKP